MAGQKLAKAKRIARIPAVKSSPPAQSESDGPRKLLKRNDLLAAMAERSDLPRSDLRAVLELALDEIGRALSQGHDLAVPPLGRLKVTKTRDTGPAEILNLRLRRKSTETEE
ncbi:MAG: HU family DNA-binding protein [Pseudomonadota bacterium]